MLMMLLWTLLMNFYAYWCYFRHYLWTVMLTYVTSDITYQLLCLWCYFGHYLWTFMLTDVTSDITYELLCLPMLLQILLKLLCLPMLLKTLFTWRDQRFLNGIFSLWIQRGERKRPFWRHRHRWEDNIKVNFKSLVQDKGQVAAFCEHGNEYSHCSKWRGGFWPLQEQAMVQRMGKLPHSKDAGTSV
jgi:hypothetical protein